MSRILVALIATSALGLAAQQPPPPPGIKTGNPTPGTAQPEPPNLAMRITVIGCVQATADGGGNAGADANAPSDARFLLTNAERTNVVPPGTGTASAAIELTDRIYRLHAIDSQLSPFVGAKVEISGEVLSPATKTGGTQVGGVVRPKPDATTASPDAATATRDAKATKSDLAAAPTLQIEFVQKMATSCS